jgi:CopG family transcriptional regulator/antitoxin EndoAI
MRQSKVVTVSIPPRLLREAEKMAKKEHRTKSEVVRDALRLYLDLQSDKGFRRAVRERAAALKVETEDKIERLVDEVRK